MRTRSLILLVLLVPISGCIMTYRDFPIVNPLPSPYAPAAPSRCCQTVEFPGGLEEGWTFQWSYLRPFRSTYEETYRDADVWSRLRVDRALREALQNYAGCSSSSPVVYTSQRAETEVVVSVLEKPYPSYTGGLEEISARLFGLIPIYSGQGGWELSYSIYDWNALKETYKYEITPKRFIWLLLLPFSWINFFTYSLEEAVQSTTAQFVMDAQRDGYLGTKD